MKPLFIIVPILTTFIGCSNDNTAVESTPAITINEKNTTTQTPPLTTNQFQAVWSEVKSDPLTVLPQATVSYGALFTLFRNIILEDAKRTLASRVDMLLPFDKLAHPNGVCLKGVWEIDSENPYSGYFKNNSKALVIARASSAMSNTKKGEIRAFGLAVKLFATLDPLQVNDEPSANFFVIDDLGGTDADYFTDVALTNEPNISVNSEVLKFALYAQKVASAFETADENPNIRQVYEVSELAEHDLDQVITPHWIKIQAQVGQTKTAAEDFRDEFVLEGGETLVFTISVSDVEEGGVKVWQDIGTITFEDSVVSETCDHRLHFHHPKWRDDLSHSAESTVE